MKLSRVIIFISLLLCSAAALKADVSRFPEPSRPPRLVNDFAEMLKPAELQNLERKLRGYNDTSSTEITIVTMPSLNGEPAASYAVGLGEHWKVGKKGHNNGLVILISLDNPREIFIATGYGMEATITDARAKNIIENIIKPSFVKERYFEGLDQATTAIFQYASGEFKADKSGSSNGVDGVVLFLIIMAIFLLAALKSKNNNNRGRGPTTFSRRGAYMGPGFGGFGGGSFGGGSGGGFGGFGGGSFGGGGAGGKW